MYTYQAGDSDYRVVATPYGLWNVADYEAGYWVDLSTETQVPGSCPPLPYEPPPSTAEPITLAVGVGWSMISAPFNGFVINHEVQGADLMVVSDAVTKDYQAATFLKAGYGAWVYSAAGAIITLAPLPPDGQ